MEGTFSARYIFELCKNNQSHDLLTFLQNNPSFNINLQIINGDTPLHYCSMHTAIDCLKILMNYGADVNLKNNNGDTPLHDAAIYTWRHIDIDYMKALIDYGADITIKNNGGETFLDLIEDEIIKQEMEKYLEDNQELDVKYVDISEY